MTSLLLLLLVSASLLYALRSSWREEYPIYVEAQKLEVQDARLPTQYANQATGRIKVYAQSGGVSSEHDLKKFTGFGDSTVGVWKPNPEFPHGVEFMFRIAIDYFRCGGKRTELVTSREKLAELDYVVTPWNVADLPSWGWKLVADVDYVYVYQNPRRL